MDDKTSGKTSCVTRGQTVMMVIETMPWLGDV
jgi:hypothetical protein